MSDVQSTKGNDSKEDMEAAVRTYAKQFILGRPFLYFADTDEELEDLERGKEEDKEEEGISWEKWEARGKMLGCFRMILSGLGKRNFLSAEEAKMMKDAVPVETLTEVDDSRTAEEVAGLVDFSVTGVVQGVGEGVKADNRQMHQVLPTVPRGEAWVGKGLVVNGGFFAVTVLVVARMGDRYGKDVRFRLVKCGYLESNSHLEFEFTLQGGENRELVDDSGRATGVVDFHACLVWMEKGKARNVMVKRSFEVDMATGFDAVEEAGFETEKEAGFNTAEEAGFDTEEEAIACEVKAFFEERGKSRLVEACRDVAHFAFRDAGRFVETIDGEDQLVENLVKNIVVTATMEGTRMNTGQTVKCEASSNESVVKVEGLDECREWEVSVFIENNNCDPVRLLLFITSTFMLAGSSGPSEHLVKIWGDVVPRIQIDGSDYRGLTFGIVVEKGKKMMEVEVSVVVVTGDGLNSGFSAEDEKVLKFIF